uniref:Uncharacterized protein n=1 Tax=Alexandrium catenella TaxID=2925 RepID=A0A7S1SBI2_ALECA
MGCCSSRSGSWQLLTAGSDLDGAQRTSLLLWLRGGGGQPGPKVDFESLTRLDLSEHFVLSCDFVNSDGEEVEEELFDRKAFGAFVREVLPRLTGIMDLSLSSNELFAREESIQTVASFVSALKAGPLDGCHSLNISGNSLGSAPPECARAFLEGLPSGLLHLDVSENRLHLFGTGASVAAGLWESLCKARSGLAFLSLARNNLCRLSPARKPAEAAEGDAEGSSWEVLGAALELLPSLTSLDLSENELDGAPAASLAKAVLPRLLSLRQLNLTGNGPRDGSAGALGQEAQGLVRAAVPRACEVLF